MITYAMLNAARPEMWSAAGVGWKQLAGGTVFDAYRQLKTEADSLRPVWRGNRAGAAASATKTLTDQADEMLAASDEMFAVRMVLDGLGEALTVSQQTIRTVQAPGGNALTIGDDGSVRTLQGTVIAPDGTVTTTAPGPTGAPTPESAPPEFGPAVRAAHDPQYQDAQQAHLLIDQAVRAANDADQKAGQELATLAGKTTVTDPKNAENIDQNAASETQVQLLAATVPPANTDPKLVAKWWSGLTPDQRRQLEKAAPASLYHLNGLPASVRSDLAGPGGVDHEKLVEWANGNWHNSSIDFVDKTKNDCANFVSTGLAAAGLEKTGDGIVNKKDPNSWNDNSFTVVNDRTRTRTWSDTNQLKPYLLSHGGTEVPIHDAQPGDVLVWTQVGTNPDNPTITDGQSHHTAIVTSVTPDGDVKYTQHSPYMQDGSFQGRDPTEQSLEGNQRVEVIRMGRDPNQDGNPSPVPIPWIE